MGSLRNAILFVIDNPTQSWDFPLHQTPTLELTYRYYRNSAMCAQLDCNDLGNRDIEDNGNRMVSFGTLTHGFAPGEDPGPPPMSAPPGG